MLKPNTLIKKMCYLILCIGLCATIIIRILLPSLFYNMLSSYLAIHVTSMLRANTISQSYIWRGNSMAYKLYNSEALKEHLHQWFSSSDTDKQKKLNTYFLSLLEEEHVGQVSHQIPGNGAIVSLSYSMIYTDQGELWYPQGGADLAQVLLTSEWLNTLTPEMDMVYSPVLGDNLQVMCFAMPFVVDDHLCCSIHILDFSYIKSLFYELEANGITDYQIIQNDRILYSNTDHDYKQDSWPDSIYNHLQYETSYIKDAQGITFLTLCSYEGENVQVLSYASRPTLLKAFEKLVNVIGYLLDITILIIILLIILLLRHLLHRLTLLSDNISQVTAGNYTLLPEDTHNDEIKSLTLNFNQMIRTIQHDMDEKIKHEEKEHQMQYSLLVSAIDPHFIYNTLNTISFLAHMNKTDEIVQVNTALIGTLKDRLSIKNYKNFDTLKTEKEILEQYILIQSYLCHNTIHYSFEADPEELDLKIPKNILQPLVENSIKHGLLPHKDPIMHQILDGEIQLKVTKTNEHLTIMIADNGVGFTQEQMLTYFVSPLSEANELTNGHIGIFNIRGRLDYLLKDQYQFTVSEREGGGSIILLTLPIIP